MKYIRINFTNNKIKIVNDPVIEEVNSYYPYGYVPIGEHDLQTCKYIGIIYTTTPQAFIVNQLGYTTNKKQAEQGIREMMNLYKDAGKFVQGLPDSMWQINQEKNGFIVSKIIGQVYPIEEVESKKQENPVQPVKKPTKHKPVEPAIEKNKKYYIEVDTNNNIYFTSNKTGKGNQKPVNNDIFKGEQYLAIQYQRNKEKGLDFIRANVFPQFNNANHWLLERFDELYARAHYKSPQLYQNFHEQQSRFEGKYFTSYRYAGVYEERIGMVLKVSEIEKRN